MKDEERSGSGLFLCLIEGTKELHCSNLATGKFGDVYT
jgi:hypothetical protein